MSGPVPSERPTFTREHGQDCARLVRQQHAPQLQGARATLALLLHARPERDSVTAARQRGRHPNWAYTWRKRRATSGFALTDRPGRGRPPAFPQRAVATVKALARELPTRREQPLSRYRPAAPPPRASTIGRILATAAPRPWPPQRWRYPRDPPFAAKTGRVLDRYAGWWAGAPLSPG